ncbi:uncharacterized protein EI90DRAFT_3123553 [Cantharellus anzutake]|uniref:uncharacterized protein n=1 Tax=Cantharellus anzutake TaxID=1750568 RepID=UPI001906D262|nr:uncharacterized protein EI90DRAFT_3123553 [Cantharellus anzutake]KAF8331412.1 hypothetical protein EI90DRAFT_3123553 [Cantharellus anzutake]
MPHSKTPKKKKTRRNPGDCENVDPGLDAFINAQWLPKDDPCLGCQRKVLEVHFGNDHISKPRSCCKRCDLHKPVTCCDLHTPSLAASMFHQELAVQPSKWHPQHVKPNYIKDVKHSAQLSCALKGWRKDKFSHHYPGHQDNLWIGDWAVLGDSIINDIVYDANFNQLSTPQDFMQLIDWEE